MCLVGVVTRRPRVVLLHHYDLTTMLVPKMWHDYCFNGRQSLCCVSINYAMMMRVQLFSVWGDIRTCGMHTFIATADSKHI